MIGRLPGLILPTLALAALLAGAVWALVHTIRNRSTR